MVCKMLFFDYRESEKPFFEINKTDHFDIKFFTNALNRKTVKEIDYRDLEQTTVLNIYTPSIISADIINLFPNLRVISVRSPETKNIDLKKCFERNIAVVNINTPSNDYKNVQTSFNMITSVFCGCKENRVV